MYFISGGYYVTAGSYNEYYGSLALTSGMALNVSMEKGSFKITDDVTGASYGSSFWSSSGSIECGGRTLYLGAINNLSGGQKADVSILECKIYEYSTLVHHFMPARNILHSDIAFATERTIPCAAFVSLAFAGDIGADSVPLILFWASITVGLVAALPAAVRDKKPSVDASLIDRRQSFLLRMESVLWVVYLCAGYWFFMESMGKVKMIVFGVLIAVLGGIICSTTSGKSKMAKYYKANTLPVFLIVLFALDLRFPLDDLGALVLDVTLSVIMLSMLYRKWTLNHR